MGTNPLRGEADLVAGDQTYKLVFDVNAFICAEQALGGMTTDEIVERYERTQAKADMTLLRALVYGGLQREHPCHLIQAGEIVADAGIASVRDAVRTGLGAAFGMKPAEDKEEPDPPVAPDETGTG
ncbi:hypothetical protein [Sphingomonas immobilis]|uniref:Gene transfer agent family protein n=1 Tax=Sphingomonas immobilis TaxID=3063997 RepID=A0ABT8ZU31_9SPHN|nr:hypothetical protein [Sphingomonas sp. CA1-15]MDO7841078.1 hypothetical protein [Sphingomonas sp. CA1-15]